MASSAKVAAASADSGYQGTGRGRPWKAVRYPSQQGPFEILRMDTSRPRGEKEPEKRYSRYVGCDAVETPRNWLEWLAQTWGVGWYKVRDGLGGETPFVVDAEVLRRVERRQASPPEVNPPPRPGPSQAVLPLQLVPEPTAMEKRIEALEQRIARLCDLAENGREDEDDDDDEDEDEDEDDEGPAQNAPSLSEQLQARLAEAEAIKTSLGIKDKPPVDLMAMMRLGLELYNGFVARQAPQAQQALPNPGEPPAAAPAGDGYGVDPGWAPLCRAAEARGLGPEQVAVLFAEYLKAMGAGQPATTGAAGDVAPPVA